MYPNLISRWIELLHIAFQVLKVQIGLFDDVAVVTDVHSHFEGVDDSSFHDLQLDFFVEFKVDFIVGRLILETVPIDQRNLLDLIFRIDEP